MKVCVDPGHSGSFEPGACGADGTTEAGLNILIASQLARVLESAGHEVLMTRTGNINSDSLMARCKVANQFGADYFVSIHCNSAANLAARGVETYHFSQSHRGYLLAQQVQQSLVDLGYSLDRGVKEAAFTVLQYTNMPAILVECGFMSSQEDLAILNNAAWQQKIAAAIADGIFKIGYS